MASFEIERKFLVARVPDGLGEGKPIAQGYLVVAADGAEVRLRRLGERCYETYKRGEGLRRVEVEIELTPGQFDALWPLTEGRRLEKRRFVLRQGPHTIEVDRYEGDLAGLLTAEVEFDDEAESRSFTPPDWFGAEVTDDPRYRNRALARDGRPR